MDRGLRSEDAVTVEIAGIDDARVSWGSYLAYLAYLNVVDWPL